MNRRRVGYQCVRALVCLIPILGCQEMKSFRATVPRDHGLTMVLTGIEGAHPCHECFVGGLKAGGVRTEIDIVDWTIGEPALLLVNLRYEARNRYQAAQIATRIVNYQDQYPRRPVNLIGHSGGAGVALLVLEALPPERQVDCVILLAAAISPEYNLWAVLPKVRREIWNYSSPIGDSLLLIAGTTVFGTIDGRHSPSAGAVGFRVPFFTSRTECDFYYRKLVERPYQLQMALHGNLSGHYGSLNYLFAHDELAPILLGGPPLPDGTISLQKQTGTQTARQ